MGIDYTSFAAWGVPLKGNQADELDERSKLLKQQRVSYASFGNAYSGPCRVMLVLDESHFEVDNRRDNFQCKRLPDDRDWDRVDAVGRLYQVRDDLKAEGLSIEFDGEPGWYVCGHVW